MRKIIQHFNVHLLQKNILLICLFSSITAFNLSYSQESGSTKNKLKFINTAFENASPLDWEIDSKGVINISLIYDHERSSPNRAVNHWYFQIQADSGSDLQLVLKNFDNIWNGKRAYPISTKTIPQTQLSRLKTMHWKPG